MKHIYYLLFAFFGLSTSMSAQNTVTVDGGANWLGFANVFENPANGGGYIFGSPWEVPDLKSTIGVGDDTVTLQPNFNTYGDGTDPFWVNLGTGEGNKDFEANTFIENPALLGAPLTFTGNVSSNTLDAGYQAIAFIKVFQANFSVLKIETAPLVEGEDFAVEYTNVEGADEVIQYGFLIRGLNGNPANETALGSIVVGVASDCDQDGILNASDPVENYTVSGPVDQYIATTDGQSNCSFVVNYDAIFPNNPCNSGDTFTITQTAGFASGSEFPVGTTTNTFEIENEAGTVETYSFDVTVVDGTAPTIDCLEDATVGTDDSGIYVIEDYSSIASDNCDANVAVVQEPAAGETIANGESQEITITATDEAGNVSSCSFTLTADSTLGLNELSLNAAISMYPNPASNQLTIDFQNGTIENITIFNVVGAKVLETQASSFDITRLRTGTYFVQVTTDTGILTKRLLKK